MISRRSIIASSALAMPFAVGAAEVDATDELGICYEQTLRCVLLDSPDGLVVHGQLAYHEIGSLHAWAEIDDMAIDLSFDGRIIFGAKSVYYRKNQVVALVRYTSAEALRHLLDSRSFGPWGGALTNLTEGEYADDGDLLVWRRP